MSSATPRRDGNEHGRAACNAGGRAVHDSPKHAPDGRGVPRSPGRTRQHGVCYRWAPRQGPGQHPATYRLSARTYCGLRGPPVSRQESSCVAPADAHGDLHGPVARGSCPADKRSSYNAEFHAETSGLRTTSSAKGSHRLRVLREHATPRLHQVSEDVCEAAVADVPDPEGSHRDDSAHEPRNRPRSRRVHDSGPTEHLVSSADSASSPQGVYHGRSHTDEGPSRRAASPAAYKTPLGPVVQHQVHVETHPLPFLSCSHGQNGQLTVSLKPCAVSVGPSTRSRATSLARQRLTMSVPLWSNCKSTSRTGRDRSNHTNVPGDSTTRSQATKRMKIFIHART